MKRGKKTTSDKTKYYEVLAVALFFLATYLVLCFACYNPRDSFFLEATRFDQSVIRNITGSYGKEIAGLFMRLFGLASYLFPAMLLLLSYKAFILAPLRYPWLHAVGFVLLVLSLATGLHLLAWLAADNGGQMRYLGETVPAGGLLGDYLSARLVAWLGFLGAVLAVLLVLIAAVLIYGNVSLRSFGRGCAGLTRWALRRLSALRQGCARVVGRLKSLCKRQRKQEARPVDMPEPAEEAAQGSPFDTLRADDLGGPEPAEEAHALDPFAVPVAEPTKKQRKKKKSKPHTQQSVSFAPIIPLEEDNPFQLPPLGFLDYRQKIDRQRFHEFYRQQSRLLEQKLKEFNITGRVIGVKPGPVITRYDFRVGPSIKIRHIKNLDADISLALRVDSIRVISVPDQQALGFEVPNREDLREIIALRDVVESTSFAKKHEIPIALGKDISGNPVCVDLARMPHLLIGGATGSGKSICLNAILISLLYRFTPEELQLILIDPKQIEFNIYEDLPHLTAPVIIDPNNATKALQWAVAKMEECYQDLASQRLRNIKEYNHEIVRMRTQGLPEEQIPQIMPYRVIIIDEFGDLMMASRGNKLDEYILRLAQKARAVGIHLIMATQRPSVDVITGLIKANLRARVAFKVTQRTDSKTILDHIGAENLLGRGDMLYRPPNRDILHRVHGAYVSTSEVKQVVDFLKAQRDPDYDESVLFDAEEEPLEHSDNLLEKEQDPLYRNAVTLVVSNRMASVSMLQRRLKVGHARASRLIDMMEYDHVVGPFAGSKMRKVYATKHILSAWQQAGADREALRELTNEKK